MPSSALPPGLRALTVPYADAAAGIRLYYEASGEGAALLLIPGFGCTVEIYFANAPALSERYRVIVFDPRGAGRSSVPDDLTTYTMAAYADDCIAVMRAAGVEAAHVFGTSFGGMVAQNLAILHPNRVRRLVLGCTTPGGSHHVLPEMDAIATFLGAAEERDPERSVRMRYPMHYSDAYIATHDAEIVGRAVATAHLGSTPAGRAGQLAAVNTHDTWDALPRIAAPTLVAHGEDDGLVPVENARNIAARIPGATLSIYPGAKHMFFVECAAALNAEIATFLAGGYVAEAARVLV